MGQDFLYKTISNQIRNWIQQGRFEVSKKLPTTTKLAEEFNTSPMTVNKALEILVKDGFITRSAGKGTFVKERTKIHTSESVKAHGVIGAIVYDTSSHFLWSRALRGIEDTLQINGFNLMIGNDDGNFEKASTYIDNFSKLNIDGIIFVPIGCVSKSEYEEKNLKLIRKIEQLGIPYILFHRLLNSYNTTAVTLDDYNATLQLINQFLTRKITYPICLSHYYTSCCALRERAFIDALAEHGYSNPQQHVRRIQPSGQKVDVQVQDQILQLLRKNPEVDGIFAVENDILSMTIDVVKNDAQLGAKKIPFSCFDYSGTVDSDIVTDIMDIPIYEMGSFAGEMILRKIHAGKFIEHKILFSSSFRSR